MAVVPVLLALATPRRPPGDGTAGLSARLAPLHAALASLVADLDPGCLTGAGAASLYGDLCGLERLVCGAKTLPAPRIAESGRWAEEGHRSAAGLLATLEGGSAGAARRTLEAGRRLVDLPGTEAALRAGTLSAPKLTELTQAGAVDPDAEGSLLAGSDAEPLHVVRERCQRVRTQGAGADPVATLARIHAERSFAGWIDAEGAFCFSGRDTAERGARLLARLAPVAARLRHDRRRAAAADGGPARGSGGRASPVPPEPEAALRADALFLLVCGTGPEAPPPEAPPGGSPAPGATATTDASTRDGADTPDDTALADPAGLGSADDLARAAPGATVIVRVDLAALRRGRAAAGELCELDGHGPVAVPVVQSLIDDAYLACVFTEAGDIRAVAHLGRTINAPLRTALALRDRHCVVPGCGVAYSLEIDHVRPLEAGGDTRLDNLALLCRHHHRLKTYEGWTLERTGPTDEDPRWRFTPLAPFGQEPDLGPDRTVPNRCRGREGHQTWCVGHHHEVRPPTVVRCSGVPSFGHTPPGCRSSIRSPRCEPPRLVRSDSVRPSCRCSRRTSTRVRLAAGRRGESPARHSTSSAMRFPTPATRDWSSSRAFTGADDPSSAAARPAAPIEAASGPRPDRSGSSDTPPRRRGSCTTIRPPSANVTAHRSQAGSARVGA